MLISQLVLCQEGGSRRGILGAHLWFLNEDMDNRVIVDIMDNVLLPQQRYPEVSVPISPLLTDMYPKQRN